MNGTLILEDQTKLVGKAFGAKVSVAGEVVFSTGMVGYPESFTDPSYRGQILVLTYPVIGNYGVPDKEFWESGRIQVAGLIISQYIDTPSHYHSVMTLGYWFEKEGIPILEIKDTRFLTQKIREQGAMLGKIEFDKKIDFEDSNRRNLVSEVSTKEVTVKGSGKKTIVIFDCGGKANIERDFLKRGIRIITVPWNYNIFNSPHKFDALFFSNGPGDPKTVIDTIEIIKEGLKRKIPILGICLGHQLLALAAGGDTYKLKFGHRGQNQPCHLVGSKRCFLTTQNHGYAVGKIPPGFRPWFFNANDNTNEGIIHEKYPFMSVQFHPEVNPGPMDTDWIFDYFLEKI